MQYLQLVYLAERKREALAGLKQVPVRSGFPALDTPRNERRRTSAPLDDDRLFFTDGPYIETKEYLAGRRCR
jgi:hypothetical protein